MRTGEARPEGAVEAVRQPGHRLQGAWLAARRNRRGGRCAVGRAWDASRGSGPLEDRRAIARAGGSRAKCTELDTTVAAARRCRPGRVIAAALADRCKGFALVRAAACAGAALTLADRVHEKGHARLRDRRVATGDDWRQSWRGRVRTRVRRVKRWGNRQRWRRGCLHGEGTIAVEQVAAALPV